jgi:hypothetical protein
MMTEPPADSAAPAAAAAAPAAAVPATPAAAAAPAATPGPELGTDAVELLVRAVGQLHPADRDRVFAWLLRRDAGAPAPAGPFLMAPEGAARRIAWAFNTELRTQTPAQEDLVRGLRGPSAAQQMVPVRFSTDQHAQLREWCAEHGFSMATVIRGLVARFLEGQLPGQA